MLTDLDQKQSRSAKKLLNYKIKITQAVVLVDVISNVDITVDAAS